MKSELSSSLCQEMLFEIFAYLSQVPSHTYISLSMSLFIKAVAKKKKRLYVI